MQRSDQKIERWENQPEMSKKVWQYFDYQVAPSIVRAALSCPTLTLADLYHALSMARLKCEWIKSCTPKSQQEIEQYAKKHTPASFYKKGLSFGCYQAGGSEETNPLDEKYWGSAVAITKKRLGEEIDYNYVGLSKAYSSDSIHHPTGYVLGPLENDFKKLLNTSTLFEYLCLTARILYELSNFPPIVQGSLAVHKWIYNNIFKIKFNTNVDIIPLHADWISFYETPEQFQAYFVISALAEYLKSKPEVYARHKKFFDTLYDTMLKPPIIEKNLQARKKLWEDLKKIIRPLAESDANLTQVANGHLTFRSPSAGVTKLVEDIKSKNISAIDPIYFSKLYKLNWALSRAHLQALGDPEKEKALNELWTDLEFLRYRITHHDLVELSTKIKMPAVEDLPVTVQRDQHGSFLHDIGHYEMPSEQQEVVLKRFAPLLELSLINGGMTLGNAINLNLTERKMRILQSAAALLLYNSHQFIRADRLVGRNDEQTQNNILRWVAKIYLDEDLKEIENGDARIILMSSIAVELYKRGNIKLSPLFLGGSDTIFKNILKLFLKNYFNEDQANYVDSLPEETAKQYLLSLIIIITRLESEKTLEDSPRLESEKTLEDPRDLLKQRRLDAFVLMHLNKDHIRLMLEPNWGLFDFFDNDEEDKRATENYELWKGKLRKPIEGDSEKKSHPTKSSKLDL